jgi:hypothetical protein
LGIKDNLGHGFLNFCAQINEKEEILAWCIFLFKPNRHF